MRAVVFDNEAVQALCAITHPKHRVVLAHLGAIAERRRSGKDVSAVVPTAIRAEAGWDRTDPRSASINRMRVADRSLGTEEANVAARIVGVTGAGLADAHLGATVRALAAEEVVVLTSDPGDVVRVCWPRRVTTVRI